MSLNTHYQEILSALQHYPIMAPVGYVLIHMAMAALFIPCSPMTIVAGMLWGKYLGLVISVIAATLSTSFTFLLARYFLHDFMAAKLRTRYAKFDWLLSLVERHDWKVVAFVQLNPVFPASTIGYFFGLTRIELKKFAGYSMLFMAPLQLILVQLGAVLKGPIDATQIGLTGTLLLALAILVRYLKKYTSKLVKES